MEAFFIVILVVAVGIAFRVLAGSIDGDRIETYVRDRGWTLLDKSWDPFGPGWFGEKDSRIYQIVYRDKQGDIHKAHVKTSMMSGVYLTNDHVVEYAKDELEERQGDELREENERLRQRIRELERGRGFGEAGD